MTAAVMIAVFSSGLGARAAEEPTESTQPPEPPIGLLDPSSLVVHEGDLSVRENGSLIENLEIRGRLNIEATGVVVRNVWVYTADFWTIYVASGSARFEHVEIGHPDHISERGIGGNNVVGRYLDIHHVEDGVKLASNSLYERIHVHDLASMSDDPHFDAIQADGGMSGAVIRDSILDASVLGGNSAVFLGTDLGPIDDVVIENNYINGGGWMVHLDDAQHGPPTNVVFEGNRFGPDYGFGPAALDGPVVARRNTWDATGEPVDLRYTGPPVTPRPAGEPEQQPTSTTITATTASISPTAPAPGPSGTETAPARPATGLAGPESGPTPEGGSTSLLLVVTAGLGGAAAGAAIVWLRMRSRAQPPRLRAID